MTAVLKIINPTVFEEVPTMLRTRIFSDIPGTPGRSVQIPRMIRSICACPRRVIERVYDLGISQTIDLRYDPRRIPFFASVSRPISSFRCLKLMSSLLRSRWAYTVR